MSGLVCPHCGKNIEVFARVSPERSIWSEVAPLGRVPLDPTLGAASVSSAQDEAFDATAAQVIDALERRAAA